MVRLLNDADVVFLNEFSFFIAILVRWLYNQTILFEIYVKLRGRSKA